ncbi:hypothetical protein TNCV_720351 [Trichonephila clavipes]|nr:hypothetical protein TNCV_720351 [Trichonephila clavipes]
MNFLKRIVAIWYIDWLSRSPDLNSIEHIWDCQGTIISQRDPPPRTRGLKCCTFGRMGFVASNIYRYPYKQHEDREVVRLVYSSEWWSQSILDGETFPEVPNSQRTIEFWAFHIQEVETLTPIIQFTVNIFDVPSPSQWSRLLSSCS